MTEKARNARHVKLKGKHLQTLRDYADAVDWLDRFPVVYGPRREELLNLIASLNPEVLTEDDAGSFLTSETFRVVSDMTDGTSEMTDAKRAECSSALVVRLKDRIESLPDKFQIRISLPSFPKLDEATVRVSDDVRLVVAKTSLARLVSEQSGWTPLARAVSNMHQPLQAFLEFDAVGFFNGIGSSAASRCMSTAKQCAFLFSATGAGQYEWSSGAASATFDPSPFGARNAPFELPHSLSRCFGRLKANEAKWVVYGSKKGTLSTLLGGSGRPPETELERVEALQSSLYPIGRFLACREHPEFTSIAAAMEWHQDSEWADNQTFAYLAACIGLEAVMGSDGHMENMSRRLADRYAFLIGRGRREREKLVKQYEAVLNLRGRLVHAKAARLAAKDELLLRQAQGMLVQVIWHEMHEMYRTIEREKKSAGQPS